MNKEPFGIQILPIKADGSPIEVAFYAGLTVQSNVIGRYGSNLSTQTTPLGIL